MDTLEVQVDTDHQEVRIWRPLLRGESQELYGKVVESLSELAALPAVSEATEEPELVRLNFTDKTGPGSLGQFLLNKRVAFSTAHVNFYEDGRY